MAFFSPIFSSRSRRSTNRLAFRATHVASAIALLSATGLAAQGLTDITITDTLSRCTGSDPERLGQLQKALQCGTNCGTNGQTNCTY